MALAQAAPPMLPSYAQPVTAPPPPAPVDQDVTHAPFHLEQLSDEPTALSLSAALDRWREKYPDVRVRHDVIHGHPARMLANYSARADLVVIGRHGDPGIGSVQHALLDHARGPVAVVPSSG